MPKKQEFEHLSRDPGESVPLDINPQEKKTLRKKDETNVKRSRFNVTFIEDPDIVDMDQRFTESRIVPSIESILARKSTKPSTKIRLLMEYYDFELETAKDLVREAVQRYGFRRVSDTYSHTLGHPSK